MHDGVLYCFKENEYLILVFLLLICYILEYCAVNYKYNIFSNLGEKNARFKRNQYQCVS